MDLKKFRKLKGWSQTELAIKSGVSQTYISDLELNRKHPTIPIVKKLAVALEVNISELLEEVSKIIA